MLIEVAIETIHDNYRPTLFIFTKSHCLIKTLHLIVYYAIFTKLCMSKVQYVGGKNMTSYKCVTSFRCKAAILFTEYA